MEVKREGKRVQDSSVVMSQLMSIQDTNIAGNVHGGVIMKLIDTAAGVAAVRHARANAVTASIDRLDFHHPVFVGDVLTLRASLNHVGRTSMEVETAPRSSGREGSSPFLSFTREPAGLMAYNGITITSAGTRPPVPGGAQG